MSVEPWNPPFLPTRVDGDPDRVALLIPGGGYSAERPLLHFARAVFMKHGWTTQEVWWSRQPPRPGDDRTAWLGRLRTFAIEQVGSVLDAETASQIVLVGKSLGTFAAALAADRALPGIWLTPILRDSETPADLRRCTAPFLLVGGTADPAWDPDTARSFGQPILEIANADHGLETDDDPVNSADILKRVTIAMENFVGSL